jgi:hypothetical protein
MALDLELFAISNKANFIIEKSRQNRHYAIDLDKICDIDKLKLHLEMVRADPNEKDFEESLTKLIKDNEIITGFYPAKKNDDFRFYSKTRQYETLNYLLLKFFSDKTIQTRIQNNSLFYGGTDIDYSKQHTAFRYLTDERTAEVCDLLNSVDFDSLLPYYDKEKMEQAGVYKLTRPENLENLRDEFQELKQFYNNAKNIDAFILAKID